MSGNGGYVGKQAHHVAYSIMKKNGDVTEHNRLVKAFLAGFSFAKGLEERPRRVRMVGDGAMRVIEEAVTSYFNLQDFDIWECCRDKDMVRARKWIWYWQRACLGVSYPEMGKYARKNHSTVFFGVNSIISDARVYRGVYMEYEHLNKIMIECGFTPEKLRSKDGLSIENRW